MGKQAKRETIKDACHRFLFQSLDDGSGNYAEAQNLIVPNIPHARLVTVPGAGHFVWLGSATPSWEAQMMSFLKTYVP